MKPRRIAEWFNGIRHCPTCQTTMRLTNGILVGLAFGLVASLVIAALGEIPISEDLWKLIALIFLFAWIFKYLFPLLAKWERIDSNGN